MKRSGAARRVVAVIMAAGAAMILCFTGRSTTAAPLDPVPRTPPAALSVSADAVDLNTAGLEELMALPGIGAVRAQAILDYRGSHGPFRYPEELIRVKGIGEGILSGVLGQITTGGESGAEDSGG